MTTELAFREIRSLARKPAKTHRLIEDSGSPDHAGVVYGILYAACGFKRYYTTFKPHRMEFPQLSEVAEGDRCGKCWKVQE